ncbi:hypothetical protein KKG46_06290, partial [Patescibacteria group bacterium]|nr:hypothetical protein [Patescibacteria group bacterium]
MARSDSHTPTGSDSNSVGGRGDDHGPVGSDVFYARFKLLLMSANDPQNRMEALFNPDQLPLDGTVVAGRLHPVGWSHPIKQYAYTNELSFSLDLLFTRMAMTYGVGFGSRRVKANNEVGEPDINAPVAWLMSFLYGAGKGLAPSPIMVVWPKTLQLVCSVDHVKPGYKRWAPDGTPVEVSVNVKFSELRRNFRTSIDVLWG